MKQKHYKWIGKPDYKPFLMQQIIEMGMIVILSVFVYTLYYLIQGTSEEVVSWTVLHVVLAMILLRQAYNSFKKLNAYGRLQYKITDQTVEIRQGNNQEDVKIIAKEKIQSIHAMKSLADRVYGTRTIKLYSGEIIGQSDEQRKRFDELENIKADKEVISLLNGDN